MSYCPSRNTIRAWCRRYCLRQLLSAYDGILEVETGPLAGQRYGLENSVVIGRCADCDLTIPIPRISRQHARFVVEGNKLLLEDLNCSNGTAVNGTRIKSIVSLHHQDKVELLEVTFKIKENMAHFHARDSTLLHDSTLQAKMNREEIPLTPDLVSFVASCR